MGAPVSKGEPGERARLVEEVARTAMGMTAGDVLQGGPGWVDFKAAVDALAVHDAALRPKEEQRIAVTLPVIAFHPDREPRVVMKWTAHFLPDDARALGKTYFPDRHPEGERCPACQDRVLLWDVRRYRAGGTGEHLAYVRARCHAQAEEIAMRAGAAHVHSMMAHPFSGDLPKDAEVLEPPPFVEGAAHPRTPAEGAGDRRCNRKCKMVTADGLATGCPVEVDPECPRHGRAASPPDGQGGDR